MDMRDTRPGPEKSLLQAWIPTYIREEVRKAAHADRRSVASIMRESLQQWLARRRYQQDSRFLEPPETES